jgi:hypothetical protein
MLVVMIVVVCCCCCTSSSSSCCCSCSYILLLFKCFLTRSLHQHVQPEGAGRGVLLHRTHPSLRGRLCTGHGQLQEGGQQVARLCAAAVRPRTALLEGKYVVSISVCVYARSFIVIFSAHFKTTLRRRSSALRRYTPWPVPTWTCSRSSAHSTPSRTVLIISFVSFFILLLFSRFIGDDAI